MNVTKEDFVAGLAMERVRRIAARAREQRDRDLIYFGYRDELLDKYDRRRIRRYKQGR